MTKKHLDWVVGGVLLIFVIVFLAIFYANDFDPETKIFGYHFGIVLVGSVMILVLPLMVLSKYLDRVRKRNLMSLAKEKDWYYDEYLNVPILKVLVNKLGLKIYPHPLQSKYKGGIVGKINDWKFTVFDGEYVAGFESEDPSQTLFVLNMKGVDLPLFGLEPKTFRNRLSSVLSKSEIRFESNRNFSKSFYLYGENERDIRQTFKDEVLEFFEIHEGNSVFAYKNSLVIYQDGKTCEVGLLEDRLNLLVKIAKVLIKTSTMKKSAIKAET